MGLVELIETLEADAERELEHRRAVAQTTAREIIDAAEEAASITVTRAVAEASADAAARADVQVRAQRAQSAAQLRQARERALDTVLGGARAQLEHLRSQSDYASILDGCLAEALAALPTATEVHVDPRDAATVRELLDGAASTADLVSDLSCAGGVVLATAGRRVDNTLESRLAAAWPRLRCALAASWDDEIRAGGGGS